jgi:hypothetical protein
MAFTHGVKPKSGLDDGERPTKKQKKQQEKSAKESSKDAVTSKTPATSATIPVTAPTSAPSKATTTALPIPKLLPGEHLRDFAARVDAALPVGGLINKGIRGRDLAGVKRPQTKTEKKLQKMYKEWREEEARRKDKIQEALDEEEDAQDEDALTGKVRLPSKAELDAHNADSDSGAAAKKKGKKKRKGGAAVEDDDPWAQVGKNRSDVGKGLIGLHDVVQAPPVLKKIKERFRVFDGAKVNVEDVPKEAGSLKRREELGQERQNVLETYRRMMAARRKDVEEV